MEASDNQLETDGDAVRKLSSQQDARLSLQIFRLFPVSHEVFWFVCLFFFGSGFVFLLKLSRGFTRLIAKE